MKYHYEPGAVRWFRHDGNGDVRAHRPPKGWEAQVGGKLEFEPDPMKIVEKTLAHIDKKRAALKLEEYDPNRYGQSGDARVLEQVPA